MIDLRNEAFINLVWQKGHISIGNNPSIIRRDSCGALIFRSHYGKTESLYGWEIDHIIPESEGGSNNLSNLRPLQWENNRAKSNGKLICVRRG